MGSGNAFPFKQRRYKLLPEVEDASRSFPDLAPKLATVGIGLARLERSPSPGRALSWLFTGAPGAKPEQAFPAEHDDCSRFDPNINE